MAPWERSKEKNPLLIKNTTKRFVSLLLSVKNSVSVIKHLPAVLVRFCSTHWIKAESLHFNSIWVVSFKINSGDAQNQNYPNIYGLHCSAPDSGPLISWREKTHKVKPSMRQFFQMTRDWRSSRAEWYRGWLSSPYTESISVTTNREIILTDVPTKLKPTEFELEIRVASTKEIPGFRNWWGPHFSSLNASRLRFSACAPTTRRKLYTPAEKS